MCIIIYKPREKAVSLERLFNSQRRNPHGFGVAWASNTGNARKAKLSIFKTMDFDEFLEKYAKINKQDCLIHFRYATKGKKETVNVHPFRINENLVMAHNGTISGLEGVSEDRSDSRAFAHLYVRPMCKIKKSFYNSTQGKRWMTSLISGGTNKLCFMNRFGNPSFVNGDLGHWSHGCWFSNYTYEEEVSSGFNAKVRKFKGAKSLLYNKHVPSAKGQDIVGQSMQLPLGYGRLKTGRSMIDDLEDEVDLWEDCQSQLDESEVSGNGMNIVDEEDLDRI